MSIAERLRKAIEEDHRFKGSFRQFHLAMQDANVPGSSYANILLYLKKEEDATEPKLEFIREAARELHVRPEWLAFGTGEMREAPVRLPERRAEVRKGIIEDDRFAAINGLDQRDLEDFVDLVLAIAGSASDYPPKAVEAPLPELLEIAADVAFYIDLPLHPQARGFVHEFNTEPGDMSAYRRGAIHALQHAVQGTGRDMPLSSHEVTEIEGRYVGGSVLRRIRLMLEREAREGQEREARIRETGMRLEPVDDQSSTDGP